MRLGQLVLFTSIALGLTVPAIAATRAHPGAAAHKFARRAPKAKPKFQSPRGIEDQRATEIEAALIKAGYLSGTPSGHWDSISEAAMRKLQGDNGWQTKLVPDSRALIKIGLGPGSTAAAPLAGTAGSIASESPAQGQQ
jgi:hypothetical protein